MSGQHEELSANYTNLIKKHQELKVGSLNIEQASKKIEAKFAEYTKEIEELKTCSTNYQQEITLLKPQLEFAEMKSTRLESELKAASDNLSITIKAKNTADELNYQLRMQLSKVKSQAITKDEAIASQRQEIAEYKAKLHECEREILLHENRVKAVEKQTDLTAATLSDKIKVLEDRLKSEMGTKESLISQFNNEEKAHSETKKNCMNVEAELEECKLRLKNAENSLKSKAKALKEALDERSVLQDNISKLSAEKDLLRTEKDKANEVSKKLEEFYKEKQRLKAVKKKALKKDYELKLAQRQAMHEDLYSRCTHLYQLSNKYHANVLFAQPIVQRPAGDKAEAGEGFGRAQETL